MSELIDTHDNHATIRWKLLTSVSAMALAVSSFGAAQAADSDRPLIWIELGGQLQQLSDSQEPLSPPFMASITQPSLLKALNVQKPPAYVIGDEAKITFQPENSDWVFSASIQYGRTGATRHHHQQTANKTISEHFTVPALGGKYIGPKYYYPSGHAKFADGQAKLSESQFVLDFQAGKDVGLGLFGGQSSSVLSAGLRIAQFASKSDVQLRAEPDVQYPTAAITSKYERAAFESNDPIRFHDYAATASARRDFRGLGPSLSWNASAPMAGNSQDGEIALDIGLNAAVLFGRQRASGQHRTTNKAYQVSFESKGGGTFYRSGKKIEQIHFENLHGFEGGNGAVLPTAQHTNAPPGFNRVRNVLVPNLGGFAGLSMQYTDVKFSIGYKADFFFNAIDGGMDTRKEENRGVFGPYASISVGIGD